MTTYANKVKMMSNEELKENILSLNNKQLELIQESSQYNLFSSTVFLKNRIENLDISVDIKNSSEYIELKDYVNRVIEISKDVLKANLNDSVLNELKEIRTNLHRLSSILDGYFIELFYSGAMAEYYIKKILANRDYKDSTYNSNAVIGLIDNINQSLMEAKEDYNKYIYTISQVILGVPMRLVKDNYFNIIKNSIIRNFSTRTKLEVEKKIKEYKRIFDSSIQEGYGTKFDEYFRKVQIFRNKNLVEKDFDELIKIVDEKKELSKEIMNYYNFILELGLTVNMIIVIIQIGNYDRVDEYEELFTQWIQILDNNEEDKIDEFYTKMEKIITSIEKEMLIEIDKFYALNNHALEREGFYYEEINEELSKARKILNYYNDVDLSSSTVLDSDIDEIVSYEYLLQLSDSLINYIDRSLKSMGNIERKIRMQKLLSSIELPFSGVDEFAAYVKYSLDIKVSSKEEINYILDYINHLLIEIRQFQR